MRFVCAVAIVFIINAQLLFLLCLYRRAFGDSSPRFAGGSAELELVMGIDVLGEREKLFWNKASLVLRARERFTRGIYTPLKSGWLFDKLYPCVRIEIQNEKLWFIACMKIWAYKILLSCYYQMWLWRFYTVRYCNSITVFSAQWFNRISCLLPKMSKSLYNSTMSIQSGKKFKAISRNKFV